MNSSRGESVVVHAVLSFGRRYGFFSCDRKYSSNRNGRTRSLVECRSEGLRFGLKHPYENNFSSNSKLKIDMHTSSGSTDFLNLLKAVKKH